MGFTGMHSRRQFLAGTAKGGLSLAALGAIPGLLAACSTPAASGGFGSNTSVGGTLDFWDGPAGSEMGIAYFIPEFQDANPGLTINFTPLAAQEELEKLKAALLAGVGLPDIAGSPEANTQEFLSPDQFVDLTEVMKPYVADIAEQSLSVCTTADGKILAVPADATACGLIFRTDIFDQYGIKPTDVSTWDGYLRAGTEITNASGGKTKMLFMNRDDSDLVMLRLMHSELGSGFFSPDGTKVTVEDEANVNAVTVMKQMWDADIVWKDVTWDAQWGYMEKDQLASMPTLSWMPQIIEANTENQTGKWTLQRLPAFTADGNPNARSSGASYMIPKKAKNPWAAWKYLEYALMRPEAQLTTLQKFFLFPSNKKTYQLPGFDDPVPFFAGQKANSLWADIYVNSPAYAFTPYFQQALVTVNAVIPKILDGSVTPAAGLKEAADILRSRTGLA
jgi:ABC-type glycerol-3-phosphate transport system substrate-binding protein